MDIIVRRANHGDKKKIAMLFNEYRKFYKQVGDMILVTQFIEDRLKSGDSVIFCAEIRDANHISNLVGFTQLYPTYSSISACKQYILNDLFVVNQFRGLSAGNKLLDAAKQFVKSKGASALSLSTAKDNVGAQKLYESLGYQKDENFFYYSLSVS